MLIPILKGLHQADLCISMKIYEIFVKIINIGKNIDMLEYGFGDIEKSKAITDLRDAMATLKWEIWETEPQLKRNELNRDEWDRYVEARLSEWNFTLEHMQFIVYHTAK